MSDEDDDGDMMPTNSHSEEEIVSLTDVAVTERCWEANIIAVH